MVLSHLAERLACFVARQTGGGDRERAVLRYGSEVAMLTCGELLLIVLAAWAWDCLPTALAACLATAALRSVAGGTHCTSPGRCAVVSVLVFTGMGKVAGLWAGTPGTTAGVVLGAGLLSGAVAAVRAPLENPAKLLRSPAHRRLLRRLSLLMVFSITTAALAAALRPESGRLALALALGQSWAALMITSPGRMIIDLADRALRYRPRVRPDAPGSSFGTGRR